MKGMKKKVFAVLAVLMLAMSGFCTTTTAEEETTKQDDLLFLLFLLSLSSRSSSTTTTCSNLCSNSLPCCSTGVCCVGLTTASLSPGLPVAKCSSEGGNFACSVVSENMCQKTSGENYSCSVLR